MQYSKALLQLLSVSAILPSTYLNGCNTGVSYHDSSSNDGCTSEQVMHALNHMLTDLCSSLRISSSKRSSSSIRGELAVTWACE